ncbi:MAG: T9SS C-terminal target domain-containing protein [Bacteroidetes bacterium]|nr:MAG: T9SS C-terminal target domain-containing protein [Bacteroidota bacterium]
MPAGFHQLDLAEIEQLPNGLYFLTIKTKDGQVTQKWIQQCIID